MTLQGTPVSIRVIREGDTPADIHSTTTPSTLVTLTAYSLTGSSILLQQPRRLPQPFGGDAFGVEQVKDLRFYADVSDPTPAPGDFVLYNNTRYRIVNVDVVGSHHMELVVAQPKS